jgi:hypothetical protein
VNQEQPHNAPAFLTLRVGGTKQVVLAIPPSSFGGIGIRQKINNKERFEKMGTLLVREGCERSDCRDDFRRDGSYLATLPLGSVVASTASYLRYLCKSSSAQSTCAITDSFSRSYILTEKYIASRQMQKLSEPVHQDVEPMYARVMSADVL